MDLLRGVLKKIKRLGIFLGKDSRNLFFPRKTALPEDAIPVEKGKPDLSFYTQPLQHYIDLYNSFLNSSTKQLTLDEQNLAWKQRVHGTWGLLAKGPEAIPFLLSLIRHPNPDAREDASFLLGRLVLSEEVTKQLLACLEKESDLVAKSAIIGALGKLRYCPAIPVLGSLILDEEVDLDTRWDAADSLSLIVGQDFSGPDKLEKARAWLAAQKK